MADKQRFFPREDYIPVAYGYARVSHGVQFEKGNSIEDQERRIKAYFDLRSNDESSGLFGATWGGVLSEPNAQSAFSKPFAARPTGDKLVHELLNPSDHIIIDKLDRMFRNVEDFCVSNRWFAERGISLHFVNHFGLSVDTGSSGGGFWIKLMVMLAEMESIRIGERVRSSRASLRARGLQDGTGVPFFCMIVGLPKGKKRGCGGRVEFKPWAVEMMERIAEYRDVRKLTFRDIGTHYIDKELGSYGIPSHEYGNERHKFKIEYMYWFYKGWVDLGKPDIATISPKRVAAEYKSKVIAKRRAGG